MFKSIYIVALSPNNRYYKRRRSIADNLTSSSAYLEILNRLQKLQTDYLQHDAAAGPYSPFLHRISCHSSLSMPPILFVPNNRGQWQRFSSCPLFLHLFFVICRSEHLVYTQMYMYMSILLMFLKVMLRSAGNSYLSQSQLPSGVT